MQYLPIIATEMILASVGAIVLYWWDKRNASKNQVAAPPQSAGSPRATQHKPPTRYPRIPEQTLLLVSLLGGWPGAWWASQRFRHKTKKRSFRIKFWIVVVLNLAGTAWIVTR